MTPFVGTALDGDGLRTRLLASQELLRKFLFDALERTARQAAQYAMYGSFVSRTGALRQSIQWAAQMGTDQGVAVVRASAPYAGFIENGTRRHWVAPVRKKALSFVVNGTRCFSRGHFVSGIRPRRFMAEAQTQATPLFERLCEEAFLRAFA